jgi:DNA-binding transcriptional ArsR family regulator
MAPLRRGDTPPVTIDVAASYEMLLSLVTISETDNYPVAEVGPEWLAAIEKRAGPALMKRLGEFTQGTGDGFVHLIPLAYDAPAPRDVDTFLAHLEATDADEIVRQLLGYYDYHVQRLTSPETMRAAVDGDEQAIGDVLASCEGWPQWHPFVERLLRLGSRRAKEELLGLLRAWHEQVWREEEEQLLPILQRDAEAKRLLLRELPFERFVEVATNGVSYASRPDINRLVLIPSYVNRPWVSFGEERGALILVYPVADESINADADAPPLRLVRLTKALADEKRLRILRALADRPRSLMELAEQFEMPKTSMHHHMIALRSAGLVTVSTGAKDKTYRLRNDVLPNMATMLAGYIASPGKAASPAAPAQPVEPAAPLAAGRRRAMGSREAQPAPARARRNR